MTNEEISVAITNMDGRAKSNTHRLDKLEERQDNMDKLVTAVSNLQKDVEYTIKAINEMKSDVNLMMNMPRERWELILSVAITAAVSAIVGAIAVLIL